MNHSEAIAIIREHWALDEAGTPDQLAGLINKLRPYLLPLGRGSLPAWLAPKADDSDLAQETSIRALDGISRFTGKTPERFWCWLIVIQRNEARHLAERFQAVRRDIRNERLLNPDNDVADRGSVLKELMDRELNDIRVKVLKTLDPVDQRIIRLRIFEGANLREAAESMDMDYATARKRFARAIIRWKLACDRQNGTDTVRDDS